MNINAFKLTHTHKIQRQDSKSISSFTYISTVNSRAEKLREYKQRSTQRNSHIQARAPLILGLLSAAFSQRRCCQSN